MDCELCIPARVVAENDAAYARYDSNSLAPGHVIVVPRRHVADFFDMTAAEQAAVMDLLQRARRVIAEKHAPDGYNDVPDPAGGVRCVLNSGQRP